MARLSLLPIVLALAAAACDRPRDESRPTPPPPVLSAPSADLSRAGSPPPPPTPRLTEADLPAPPDVAAPPADAKRTPSGLATKVLKEGSGKDSPAELDRVKVHYTAWTKAGRMFDSSRTRGEPSEFRLDQVVKGFTEGLRLMVPGEKRRLWIPSSLAYGDRPQGMGMPTGDLVFDVELLSLARAPRAPEDVKSPPASATRTASGLTYRVLKPGKGTRHPGPTDIVTVHYSGWTPDGRLFDTSETGDPGTFTLGRVIKGWTEGVQLMVLDERTRFWIPADLAYGDKPKRPGAPAGPLVFDIELVAIK